MVSREIQRIDNMRITIALDAELAVLIAKTTWALEETSVGEIPADVRQYCLQSERKGRTQP